MGTGTEENVKLIDKIVSWATESGVAEGELSYHRQKFYP